MLAPRFLSLMLGAALCIAAEAAPPTFKIDSLYSNLDGSIQFIRLTETEGRNGQHRFKGLKITSIHNGVTKEYTFLNDIPTENTAHTSIAVLAAPLRGVPFLRAPGQVICCWQPYYEMPERFLPVGGGSIDFAGVDQMVYESLPTSGTQALHRDGTIGPALLPLGLCQTFPCTTGAQVVSWGVQVIEYYNQALDHFFVTASADEIDMLDTGRVPGWQRTRFGFPAHASPVLEFTDAPALLQPVCRFYIPPGLGDSHFLSASPEECDEVSERFPMFIMESRSAFHAVLPDRATGACPPVYYERNDTYILSWVPVFRFWNGRAGSNHRYTSQPEDRSEMIATGWVPEGYGPAGVAFCTPRFDF